MKLLILTLLLAIEIYCEDRKFTKLLAADKEYLVKLDRQQEQEKNCLKRLDAILTSKWTEEERKIPTEDLGEISRENSLLSDEVSSSNPLYHLILEEMLMANDGSTSERIGTCLRPVVKNIVPLLTESDVECLNKLFESHIEEEQKIEREYIDLLKNSVRDQLPFRYFLNFREFVEMMFQNRNPDALTSRERSVYEHMESHLTTEEDKDRKVFVILQDCSWKRAMALREAPNSKARFEEFLSQVRNSVNWWLGNALVTTEYLGPLNTTFIIEQHEEWLKIRQAMEMRLTEEVERLRTQQKDAQWLCEYASRLAFELFVEQSSILDMARSSKSSLEISKTALRISTVDGVLKERKDIRYDSMHKLRTEVDRASLCLEGFARLIENHQHIAVISAFTDSRHSFQEISCGKIAYHVNAIHNTLCNCVGSFCVSHGLAVLDPTHYEMVRGIDGIYKIVPSQLFIHLQKLEKESAMNDSSTTMKSLDWKNPVES